MKKKLLASLFITPVLAVLASTQVLAGNEDLAHCIELYPSQELTYSASCTGTYKYIWGENDQSSEQGVWFVAEVSKDNKSSWSEDKAARIHISPGSSFGETETAHYSETYIWRLKVDAFGPFRGCSSIGYIRNK